MFFLLKNIFKMVSLSRDLTTAEITEQIVRIEEYSSQKNDDIF